MIATHSETSPTEGIKTCIWELTTGSHILDVKATSGGLSKMLFVSENKYVSVDRFINYHKHKVTSTVTISLTAMNI